MNTTCLYSRSKNLSLNSEMLSFLNSESQYENLYY